MARSAVRTRTTLRLEQLESRYVPSTFNTIHTNPIVPGEINSNEFRQVHAGDFDADGVRDDLFFFDPGTGANQLVQNVNTATPTITNNPIAPAAIRGMSVAASGDYNGGGATNDMFFWDPVSGRNALVLALTGPVVTNNPIATSAIRRSRYTELAAGNFNTVVGGTELFFWNPSNGRNLLAADLDGVVSLTANPIARTAIDGPYTVVVAGDFNTAVTGDELFFWAPSTGRNLLVADVAGIETLTANAVARGAIRAYTVVAAGDLDAGTPGTELFFWNPETGRNRLVLDLDGAATSTNNPVDTEAINANVFSELAIGAFVDADIGLFFWNPRRGRNWAIDE